MQLSEEKEENNKLSIQIRTPTQPRIMRSLTRVYEKCQRMTATGADRFLLRYDHAMLQRANLFARPRRQQLARIDQDGAGQMADPFPSIRAGQLHLQPALRVLGEQRKGAVVAVRPAARYLLQLLLLLLLLLPHLRTVVLGQGQVDLVLGAALLAVLARPAQQLILPVVLDQRRIVEQPECGLVFALAVQYVAVLLEKVPVRQLHPDGQRLQQQGRQALEVRRQVGHVVPEAGQRFVR